MKFNTKVIHGNQHHDPSTGAVMPPVYQTSTFPNEWSGDEIQTILVLNQRKQSERGRDP